MGGEECEDVGGEGVWGVGVRRLVYMYTLHWWVRTCVRVGGCEGGKVWSETCESVLLLM